MLRRRNAETRQASDDPDGVQTHSDDLADETKYALRVSVPVRVVEDATALVGFHFVKCLLLITVRRIMPAGCKRIIERYNIRYFISKQPIKTGGVSCLNTACTCASSCLFVARR